MPGAAFPAPKITVFSVAISRSSSALSSPLAAFACALAGCQAEKERTWDYGKSFHAIFEKQKLDPAAGDDSPVVGLDGTKAAMAYERYEQAKPSEKDAASKPILSIGN